MGSAHLDKARGFFREKYWPQSLHHSDLAATKLKQLKDRPIEDISTALNYKYAALGFMDCCKEQLECAKEWYCLWNTKPTDMGAIRAAFALIESCIHNKEYEDAMLYASTLWGIINHKHDNKIPDDQRQPFIINGAYYLALATLRLAQHGGIPPEEMQKAGQEAIALARRSLEIHTRLYGAEDSHVVYMVALAEALDHFNDCDDEEVLRLLAQAKPILARVFGSSSLSVAQNEEKLGMVYLKRGRRAHAAGDLNCQLTNLELALPRLRESARIYRAIGSVDEADTVAKIATRTEVEIESAAATKR